MNTRTLIVTAIAGSLLTFGGFAAAQASKAGAAKPAAVAGKAEVSKTVVTHGTISSIDDNQVVVSEKSKDGKTSSQSFIIDKTTSKSGALNVGSEVTVHYRSDKDHLMATSLVGKAEKTKTAAKTPTKK